MIKSRRMRWAEHVAHIGKRKGIYRVLEWKPEVLSSVARVLMPGGLMTVAGTIRYYEVKKS